MLKYFLRTAICVAVLIAMCGCASGNIAKLIKNLREDPIRADGTPSETMTSLAEYGVDAAKPIIEALTVDEREYNLSLVHTLALIKEGVEPEEYAELLAHPGRGVAEAAEKIILDPETRNLTDKLSRMLATYNPASAPEPRHAEPVFRRIVYCLGKTGHPPAIPVLLKAIRQPDNRTRSMALHALARIFDRFPYTVVSRKFLLYKRYYEANIFLIIRSMMINDTDAGVRHYASMAMEAFTENGFGLFPKSQENRDVEMEKLILGRYEEWALDLYELSKYPNCPSAVRLARQLGRKVFRGRVVPKNVPQKSR